MSTSSVGNAALDNLIASYKPLETEEEKSNELGSDDFITLLVAQLENQNPLDPTDTDTFTDQLTQYTQVEELENLNAKMDVLVDAMAGSGTDIDGVDYVGMQVTGNANTMTIEQGSVSSGFYELTGPAEVTIVIRDEKGNVVNTLDQGQQEAGAYLIAWDGTDGDGTSLVDGTYTYSVLANFGSGYEEVPTSVTGTVDSVAYQNGKQFLVVGGILLDPDSLTSVTDSADGSNNDSTTSILEYLGKTVGSNYPIVRVTDGQVAGSDLTYTLDEPQDVTITVYDSKNQPVCTIEVPADETVSGENSVHWDAMTTEENDNAKHAASDGLYYYRVATPTGSAVTPVSGEVTAIESVNGVQYLVLGDSGRLVSLSTVNSIQ